MTKQSNQTKWSYQFERPGFHERARLREILTHMDIIASKQVTVRRAPMEPSSAQQGTLDEVMTKLADALEEDYATNFVEQDNAPWKFDYVVGDATPTGEIEVFTRLFDPTDPAKGKIFYGRRIKRISKDGYLLWIDD